MKTFHITYLFFLLIIISALHGCKKDSAVEPEDVDYWTKDSVMSMLDGRMWRVQTAYLISGKDTIDLAKSGFEQEAFAQRHRFIFSFIDQGVYDWAAGTTSPDLDGKFRKNAEIYRFTIKFGRYTGATYSWNDSLSTLQVNWAISGSPRFPIPYKAYLMKANTIVYKTYQEEEKATKSSCLMFKVDTESGTYLYELRQVWKFASDITLSFYDHYVVFP